MWVAGTPANELATSVIVLAEIRRGIELMRRTDPAQAGLLDRWFAEMRSRLGDHVLPVDEAVADQWARLNVPNPLPMADGLLAATALVHDLTLVTRNTKDFARTGTKLLNPFTDWPADRTRNYSAASPRRSARCWRSHIAA